jgi:hypothetical protein
MYICGSRIGGNRRWKQDKALTLTSLRCSPYHKFQTQFLFIGKQLKTLTSSSTMNSIKYACSLNNQGVDLLVSGESAKAIKAFQCALFLLEKVANEAETSACTGMNLSSEVATQPFCGSTSTVQGLHDMHCYIYDHGIIITDTSNGESDEMLSLYGAIVLFNWALTSHREGRLGREKSLKKASLLYSVVEQLLTRCTIPQDASTTILTLLATNNKAQIHYDQCEYVQSVDCMKSILTIMGSVQGFHPTPCHEDIDGILLNVVMLNTPSAAHAA